MKVVDLCKISDIEKINNINNNRIIDNFYSGDLLSFVMGHVKEENTVLITVMTSINVVAVATLLDMSAVIFAEDVNPTVDVIEKATLENIQLFKTKLSSLKLYEEILKYESLL